MLTELKLTNFRIFDDEVKVRFRPITVLIGHNNAGKSSVIKFLLMLQQSLGLGKPQFLTPEGDRVQLGIFSELKNSRTTKRNLKFELTTQESTRTASHILKRYIEAHNFSDVDIFNMKLLARVSADISYAGATQTGRTGHSLIDEQSKKLIIERKKKVSDDSVFLGLSEELSRATDSVEIGQKNLTEISNNDIKKLTEDVAKKMENLVKELTNHAAEREFLDTVRYEIDSIRHLSAVREESQRVILAAPPPMVEVGQNGQYAIPHMHKIIENNVDYEFIRSYMEKVAGISDIRFKKSSKYMHQCLAMNKTTGAEVHISNFGFGVSQCLPIFVQGAIMTRGTSLMVEQPEAQLHPTAQLEMGSFFRDLWKEHGVGSIIETHSDNVLLRLRRLVAEDTLDSEDISVAYFHHDDKKGVVVDNLDIEEDGSMEEGLPMEFFRKNIRDVLKIGRGK